MGTVTMDLDDALGWLALTHGVARYLDQPSGPAVRVGVPRGGDERVVVVVPHRDPVVGLLDAINTARAEYEALDRRAGLRLA